VASPEGESGEGIRRRRDPSPSHAFGAGPSLSRGAGEGLPPVQLPPVHKPGD